MDSLLAKSYKDIKSSDMQNITLNSTLDNGVIMKNGFIFEKQRVSYHNPPKMAISIKVDFTFLENAVNYIMKIKNELDGECNLQSDQFTYDVHIRKPDEFSCWYPLPIFEKQKQETARVLMNEGKRYAYANLKRVNDKVLTKQNERVPFALSESIKACQNYNSTFMSNNTVFLYSIIDDPFKDKTLSLPCPYDPETMSYIYPAELCVPNESQGVAMADLCTERSEATSLQLGALGSGLDQLQQALVQREDDRLQKRFVFTTLVLTISVISSIVGLLGTAMSTAALANDEAHDTNIDALIDESESHKRDIKSLAEISENNFKQIKIIKADIAFLIKITLKYEQARHVYDETKERLNKLFHILDTCKYNRAISTMALNGNQREFIKQLAYDKGIQIHLPDGICELRKHNKTVFMNFLFPITYDEHKVDIVKAIPIPKFEGEISTAPQNIPIFSAIFHQSKEFVQLTESEFNQCKVSSMCESSNPILSSEGICGPHNYLMPENSKSPCHYVETEPQPLQDFFAHEIKNSKASSLILTGPENMGIDVSCKGKTNAGLHVITLEKGPVKVKTKGICTYKSKKSAYRIGNTLHHDQLFEPQQPDILIGPHNYKTTSFGEIQVFPEIEAMSRPTMMKHTKAIVNHTATGVITFCMIGIFIILVIIFYWLYRKHISSNNDETVHTITYNSDIDSITNNRGLNSTAYLQAREFKREFNPPQIEIPPELRAKLDKAEFQDFPTPMPRSQTRPPYENLPNMTTSSPTPKRLKPEPKRQKLIDERNFQENLLNTSPIIIKK